MRRMIGMGIPINHSKRPRPKLSPPIRWLRKPTSHLANVASRFKFPFAPAIGLPRSIDLWVQGRRGLYAFRPMLEELADAAWGGANQGAIMTILSQILEPRDTWN